MQQGDIANLTAGSVDMEVLGADKSHTRVRVLFTPDSTQTAAFQTGLLVKNDKKSFINQSKIQAAARREKERGQ